MKGHVLGTCPFWFVLGFGKGKGKENLISEAAGFVLSEFLSYKLKSKVKVVGVARQQLHFLCIDKENEAKESSVAALGMCSPVLCLI